MMSMIANLLPRVTLYSENVPRRTEIQPFKLVVLIKKQYIMFAIQFITLVINWMNINEENNAATASFP